MKSGWQTQALGDLCAIELGKTPSRANAKFWDEKRETNNVWLSIADLLNGEDGVVADSREYLSNAGAALCKIVPEGTLMVSFKLTLGRLAYAGRDLYTNEAIAALSIHNEKELSREFLFYFLHFFDWQKATDNDVKLKGRTLNKAKLKLMPVHFPNPAEQQRIVGILDEAFDGIATAKASAEKNLQNARALFESHLHAVFTHRGPGWVAKKLGDMCDRVSVGHVGPTSEFYCDPSEGIPFLRSQNVRPGRLDWDGVQHVTKEFHAKLKKSHLRLGDLLFVRVGANRGDCCAILEEVAELNCANIVFARPTHGNAAYLELYCQSSPGREQLLGMTTGSAQGVINTSSVAELIVPLPSAIEQSRIVKHLDALQTETRRLEALYARKLAALDELKTSLLHQAFSGQL